MSDFKKNLKKIDPANKFENDNTTFFERKNFAQKQT